MFIVVFTKFIGALFNEKFVFCKSKLQQAQEDDFFDNFLYKIKIAKNIIITAEKFVIYEIEFSINLFIILSSTKTEITTIIKAPKICTNAVAIEIINAWKYVLLKEEKYENAKALPCPGPIE